MINLELDCQNMKERKKEREGTRERGRERCASSELSEFSRNDLS